MTKVMYDRDNDELDDAINNIKKLRDTLYRMKDEDKYPKFIRDQARELMYKANSLNIEVEKLQYHVSNV